MFEASWLFLTAKIIRFEVWFLAGISWYWVTNPVGWRSEFAFPLCNYSMIPAIPTQQCANRCFLTVRSLSDLHLRLACSYLHSLQSQVAICMASECAIAFECKTARYIIGHKYLRSWISLALFPVAERPTEDRIDFWSIFAPLRAVESFSLCFGSWRVPLSMIEWNSSSS
jgi:hypothetical protein